MSTRERAFLVAYDVSDNRRRARVARRLEATGERLQKSLFVCRLSPAAARRLRRQLEGLIERDDRLMIQPMAGQSFERPVALVLLASSFCAVLEHRARAG